MKEAHADRRVKKSKKALKSSLITLMEQKEFKDITIINIVELADVNRGTFYRHYQWKEDLLDDLANDVLEDLIYAYRFPYLHLRIFYIENLQPKSIKIFDHVKKYSSFYKLVFSLDSLKNYKLRIYQTLKKIANEDLENTIEDSKINRNLYVSYQTNAVIGMLEEWIKEDFSYPSEYMAEQLLTFIQTMRAYPSRIKITNDTLHSK